MLLNPFGPRVTVVATHNSIQYLTVLWDFSKQCSIIVCCSGLSRFL